MNACDYIRDYRVRARISYVSNMAHPSRHENMLIRALWWKQEAWMAAEGMDDAERPSYEYDVAIDAYYDAREKWRMAVREAWLNRALERGNGEAAVAIQEAARAQIKAQFSNSLEGAN